MDLTKKYNQIYTEDEHPYGDGPLSFISNLTEWMSSGRVLDIGGGNGRNSLWLADKGFDVTVQDLSVVALELAQKDATKRGVEIQTLAGNILEQGISGEYEAILCILMMHHLNVDEARELIGEMQSTTTRGGINVIFTWSNSGDFYSGADSQKFYPTMEELQGMYNNNNWEIVHSMTKEGIARQRKVTGEQMKNNLIGIVVKRKQ